MRFFACAAPAQSPVRVDSLPDGASARTPLPTVIALHGRGSDAERFAGFVRRLAPGARIISLQAPAAMDPGFTWLQLRVAEPDQEKLTADIRSALQGLRPRLAELRHEPGGCGRPILLGYSQGGVLTLALAAERLGTVAAFVALSGALPRGYPIPVKKGEASAPVFSFHARQDPLVPVEATRMALRALEVAGVPVTAVELEGGHDPTPQLREAAARRIETLLRAECPAAYAPTRSRGGHIPGFPPRGVTSGPRLDGTGRRSAHLRSVGPEGCAPSEQSGGCRLAFPALSRGPDRPHPVCQEGMK